MNKRKGFLICPVRNSDPETQKAIAAYVEKQEAEGVEMYWPARDTDQTDPHGWTICSRNRSAILDANEIHIWYDAASTGSKFDLGMVFVLLGIGWTKKVVIANPEAVKPTPHKSFENVLLKMQEMMDSYSAGGGGR
ncbi:MAG: hypothetical protein WAP51_04825 [Candidatus Sungiibacteriota bacterium]